MWGQGVLLLVYTKLLYCFVVKVLGDVAHKFVT